MTLAKDIPGYDEIGNIKVDFSKKLFEDLQNNSILELGIFKVASLESSAILSKSEYADLFDKYSLTSDITVKDLVNKIKNPHNLPLSEFKGFRLSYTTIESEMGVVTNGKFNVNIPSIDFAGNRTNQPYLNYLGHNHSCSGNDMLIYPKEYLTPAEDILKNTIRVYSNVKDIPVEDTVEISVMESRDDCFSLVKSEYVPNTDVNVKVGDAVILGDRIKNDRRGTVMYIVLGIK